ncbi:sensor histidine kinase [Sphingosinicella rhizophila]|uniref:histidine kinase n=1 Tax=Sphingosinicella rhizophila TaxID=3050082 RepID=A0ABU3Q2M4_9SPHN|nr:PAS domain-containing sensor histidine kinase [Sphingosinicella sp. GR2756]MDT9597650.1 PAS domain-containing sensor histidine kinase [Sphingosinicella sp. GR2756]
MNAEAPIAAETRPRWQRRISVAIRRSRIMPFVEIVSLVAFLGMAGISYFIVTRPGQPGALLSPPMVALLLVANLVPAMGLMVLFARRVAMARAARSPIGGRGRLHLRLVALFSVIASVPTLLVVIFASLLFQSGVQFWFSDRARIVLENADNVAQVYAAEQKERITRDTIAMSGDVVADVNEFGIDSPRFAEALFKQVVVRDLTEAALISVNNSGERQLLAQVNFDDRPLDKRVPTAVLRSLRGGEPRVVTDAGDRVEAVVRLDPQAEVYLYASRTVNPAALKQIAEGRSAASDYQRTLTRSRTLQLRFNALLLLVSLLIVATSIWIALALADKLVRPVGQLVNAARRVTAGDLSARVPRSRENDEVATLANAFNRMTGRLEEQTGALVSANAQLDNRRAFIEAVLSGVTAGIISLDWDRTVRLINSSAEGLLKTSKDQAIGQKLAALAPELDRQLDSEEREDIIQFASAGEPRTLAVKRVKVEGGHVLTFDDITEQLLDQRRAAWSDVARRIAHEIKNPLTPIQLAAERLQRRYSREITSDPATFERLTDTIIRQVGDLRRMVDEFSSFARMPKPVFREEDMAEIARQALFLHEVAHPEIGFRLDAPEPSPTLVCDRRQLGQALTNIVKNGVEAIQHKRESGDGAETKDEVALVIQERDGQLVVEVTDTGPGLPVERGRLTEPYMTTRAKGTGLGLAIVKKIVEEHFGSIEFEDNPAGGTLVRLVFDAETLARLGGGVRYSDEKAATG